MERLTIIITFRALMLMITTRSIRVNPTKALMFTIGNKDLFAPI